MHKVALPSSRNLVLGHGRRRSREAVLLNGLCIVTLPGRIGSRGCVEGTLRARVLHEGVQPVLLDFGDFVIRLLHLLVRTQFHQGARGTNPRCPGSGRRPEGRSSTCRCRGTERCLCDSRQHSGYCLRRTLSGSNHEFGVVALSLFLLGLRCLVVLYAPVRICVVQEPTKYLHRHCKVTCTIRFCSCPSAGHFRTMGAHEFNGIDRILSRQRCVHCHRPTVLGCPCNASPGDQTRCDLRMMLFPFFE